MFFTCSLHVLYMFLHVLYMFSVSSGRIKEGDEVRLKSKPDQLTTSKRFRPGWEGGGGSNSPAKLKSNLSS